MRVIHGLTLDRTELRESNSSFVPVRIGHRHCMRHDFGGLPPSFVGDALGRRSKTVGLMRCLGGVLFLAACGASGEWRAAVVPVPPTTNRVALTWSTLAPGTQYFVQTSTDLLTWTAVTNTTATNVSLTFIEGQGRIFRLSASDAPPQSVTLAWDPGVPAANIAGYFIYYGVSSRSYTNRLDVGLQTTGVVSNLVAGTAYYFATTAYTSSGLESDYSSEAVWQIAPQLWIQRLPGLPVSPQIEQQSNPKL